MRDFQGVAVGPGLRGRVLGERLGLLPVSAAQRAMPAAIVGFTGVIVCRMVLGFVEGPTFGLALKAAHTWFPADRRAIPTSLVVLGGGSIATTFTPAATRRFAPRARSKRPARCVLRPARAVRLRRTGRRSRRANGLR